MCIHCRAHAPSSYGPGISVLNEIPAQLQLVGLRLIFCIAIIEGWPRALEHVQNVLVNDWILN